MKRLNGNFLQTISHETDRLAALVKNLLDMSRIEAGLLDIRREPYAVNEVARQRCGGIPAVIGRAFAAGFGG